MQHELSDIDPQKMDSQKWDMLLDFLEHPEKYSETQKDELLGDEEVNELYQQLVETRQSLDFAKSKEGMKMPSIDAEWEKLKYEMKLKEEKQQKEEMNQNAETQQTAKLFPLWSPMRKVAAVAAVLILKLSVFVNQWELGKTCRIRLFFYVGFLRSRNLLDRILSGCHEFGIAVI